MAPRLATPTKKALSLIDGEQTVKNPFLRFGGRQPSELYSESSDLRGGFGSLAHFPGRSSGAGGNVF